MISGSEVSYLENLSSRVDEFVCFRIEGFLALLQGLKLRQDLGLLRSIDTQTL